MEHEATETDVGRRRGRAGAVAIGLGIALIVWAALYMADASLSGSGRTFESRQPYNQVKRHAREAFLGALTRAGAGALLIGIGGRLRASGGAKTP